MTRSNYGKAPQGNERAKKNAGEAKQERQYKEVLLLTISQVDISIGDEHAFTYSIEDVVKRGFRKKQKSHIDYLLQQLTKVHHKKADEETIVIHLKNIHQLINHDIWEHLSGEIKAKIEHHYDTRLEHLPNGTDEELS